MTSLEGKVAVVTGGTRGLGRVIATTLASHGCTVEAPGKFRCDVTDEHHVCEFFGEIERRYDGLDILVNCAGINHVCTFEETTGADWDAIMAVNLKGAFTVTQEAWPYLKRSRGRVVNIASVAGQYHGPKTVHYAVSKAGLISLTKCLARYGAPHGILVNAVAPGIIETDMTRDELRSAGGRAVVDMTLLKRPGTPEDVAGAVVYLAQAEYVTGHVLSVSGGAVL
jgi:3-oxoacyl-[acyl-carrier protein] reductase